MSRQTQLSAHTGVLTHVMGLLFYYLHPTSHHLLPSVITDESQKASHHSRLSQLAPSTGSDNIFLLFYGILKFDSDRSYLFVTYFSRMESHISVNFGEILSPSIFLLWNSYHVDVEVFSPVLTAPDWSLMLYLTCFLSRCWVGSA